MTSPLHFKASVLLNHEHFVVFLRRWMRMGPLNLFRFPKRTRYIPKRKPGRPRKQPPPELTPKVTPLVGHILSWNFDGVLISSLICTLTSVYGCRKVAMAVGLITGTSFIPLLPIYSISTKVIFLFAIVIHSGFVILLGDHSGCHLLYFVLWSSDNTYQQIHSPIGDLFKF